MERKKLEIEVQAKRDQINKYQTQKFQTKKNDEYQAITTAIEHLERDIAKLEDQELELMESAEQLRPETTRAEQAATAAKTQVAGQHSDLTTKVAAVEAQIAKLEEERDPPREQCRRGFARRLRPAFRDQRRSRGPAGKRSLHRLPHESDRLDEQQGEDRQGGRAVRAVQPDFVSGGVFRVSSARRGGGGGQSRQ